MAGKSEHPQQSKRLNPEKCWQAVQERDRSLNGVFVYAVRSTGIYCLPSCPSKRPQRDQVRFFKIPEAAEQAGFRACLRCRPNQTESLDPAARLVQQACRKIREQDATAPIRLRALAASLQVSPYHLQRLCKRILGISPRQYAEACRLERLKAMLRAGKDVTTALYEAGYGSSSRLYEEAPGRLGMTPAIYGRGGSGMNIGYTIVACPLGRLLVAATAKGVAAVSLADADETLIAALLAEYPAAEIHRNDSALQSWIEALLEHLSGWRPHLDLPLDLRVTAFQWRVYEQLRTIPYGDKRTYGEIAEAIGKPRAVRAVATACARNPAALIVPCHRVIRRDGHLGGYRWGLDRKQLLLDQEQKSSQHFEPQGEKSGTPVDD